MSSNWYNPNEYQYSKESSKLYKEEVTQIVVVSPKLSEEELKDLLINRIQDETQELSEENIEALALSLVSYINKHLSEMVNVEIKSTKKKDPYKEPWVEKKPKTTTQAKAKWKTSISSSSGEPK